MELAILHSAAAPSLVRLRPHFPSWRRQMTANGFGRVPPPMTSSGIRDDLAADLFWLLVRQSRHPKLRLDYPRRWAASSVSDLSGDLVRPLEVDVCNHDVH